MVVSLANCTVYSPAKVTSMAGNSKSFDIPPPFYLRCLSFFPHLALSAPQRERDQDSQQQHATGTV
jgi:hypothetical protein